MSEIYLLCGHGPDSDIICRQCAASQVAALRAKLEKLTGALEKIAERWFEPTKDKGYCVADCQANCSTLGGDAHDEHCPFQIAKQALAEAGK